MCGIVGVINRENQNKEEFEKILVRCGILWCIEDRMDMGTGFLIMEK